MPVSLARKIRRIGLMPSVKAENGLRIHRVDPELTEEAKAEIIKTLKIDHKQARKEAEQKRKADRKAHRARVKAGRKAAKTSVVPTPEVVAVPAKKEAKR